MKKLVLAATFALAATAGHADVGGLYLPDLTFPDPVPAPTISTQDCDPAAPCAS